MLEYIVKITVDPALIEGDPADFDMKEVLYWFCWDDNPLVSAEIITPDALPQDAADA